MRREPDPNGPNHRDVIQLSQPAPPGGQFTLCGTFTTTARHEKGIGTFTLDQDWGYRRNLYRDGVVLRTGAQLVSAEPTPARREQREGKTVLHFEGERGAGVKWAYTVKYRLPEQHPESGSARE